MDELRKKNIIENSRKYYDLERDFEWREWSKKIPFLSFPSHWLVRVVPPFSAAMIRFCVKTKDCDDWISVYLDCYEMLGFFGEPYWEIYPNKHDETDRFAMEDIDDLMAGIEAALQALKEKK